MSDNRLLQVIAAAVVYMAVADTVILISELVYVLR